jgi:hypothetical protein
MQLASLPNTAGLLEPIGTPRRVQIACTSGRATACETQKDTGTSRTLWWKFNGVRRDQTHLRQNTL